MSLLEGGENLRKYLQNDDGYSLLIAIGTILIFTILGLSLITLTTNGILKNNTREDIVQATDLADKGIEFMVDSLQAELGNYVLSGNIGKAQFQAKLNETITSGELSCTGGGIKIPGDTGNTTVCIDVKNIQNVYTEKDDGTKILQELKKQVPIISTGLVDGKERVTTAKVIIGTDAIPDQLRYALSTNNGGNLYLHGGVEIQGDIKTDNDLIISSNATWFSGSTAIWQPSVRAKLTASPGSVTPKVIFSKENRAVYDLNKFQDYNNHINGTNLSKAGYYTKFDTATAAGQTAISNLFFNSPAISVITKSSVPQDTVEITTKILDRYNASSNKANYTNNLEITTTNHPTRSYGKKDAVFVSSTATEKVQETYTYYENVCIKQEDKWILWPIWKEKVCVEWEQQERTGTRLVDRNTFKFGSMTINGGTKTDRKDITLKGTYYVYGDLTITNVNLKADAILYVQGKVDISESTIQGVDENSTMIVFANGNIDMYNLSVNSNQANASKIKGFFYTKQDMLMYGVGSNINLTGGISARRLILTAVRGDTANGYLSATQQAQLLNGTAKQYSRLKIIYDEDLITTYTEFTRDEEEEYIKSVNEPEMVDRY